MKDLVQKAIEDITVRSKRFPEEPFRIISENQELAVPYLNSAIEKAIFEKDDLDEDYQLHFYALYLLGQFREKKSFPKIMELISLPSEVIDYLIGDAVTSNLCDILYNTYNGDMELLKESVKNPDIDDYARSSMLKTMGQLYLDGSLEKSEFQDFIRQIVYEKEEIGEYIYTELIYIICECSFVEMLPEIRRLLEDGRVEQYTIGEYAECVDMMFDDRGDICKTPINAADLLRGWAMFEQPKKKELSKKDMKALISAANAEYERPQKKVKIGRNDPCPCGSGKKYKHCCLNKPKELTDEVQAESEQERKKWLKYYPVSASNREEGRIYLEDCFDSESIEIDKLLYLALRHRPIPMWQREEEELVDNRKRIYLSEAFAKFGEKVEKEDIKTFREYDEKYSIHYQCREWMGVLQMLLEKNGDCELLEAVSQCRKNMNGCG